MISINWVDLFMLCIVARVVLVGLTTGFVPGLFYFLGILSANFFAFHYYTAFGAVAAKFLRMSVPLADLLAFVGLTAIPIGIFVFVRSGCQILFKVDAKSFVDRWGGFGLSLLSAYLICGLIFFGLAVSKNTVVRKQLNGSFSRYLFKKSGPRVYQMSYKGVIKPLFPNEPFNASVLKFEAAASGKSGS
ncbi:MAG: CvpA family protein [Candidatus Omnitrophica bacterium]|nr:CvpA family protein [Candidatus Omnitrophota bacterium]